MNRMIGAIAGDMIGSPFEHHHIKTTLFLLFGSLTRWTDDSVMTVAVASAILDGSDYAGAMRVRAALPARRVWSDVHTLAR
jgi:ADP-ribosylglycohydrolase